MTEPDMMEALKRAYAEMILNTAKEAAARVMAAESRARRLEQDLVSTKEEAARMLLHLKQMIDANTKQVEITSLNQHKKIDVLESQLNEAEGIIIDLRAELNQAHERLDEAKNEKLYFSRQNENAEVPEGTDSGYCEFSTICGNSTSEWSMLDQIGCSRKIHAAETSLGQDRFLVVDDESNPNANLTNVEIVNGDGASVIEEQARYVKDDGVVSIVRRSFRKRKSKFLCDVFTACGLDQSCKLKKPRSFPNLSCCDTSNVKSSVESGEDRFESEDGTEIKKS
ncbi:hypothetical protein OROMI_032516 [Orobanche minor]